MATKVFAASLQDRWHGCRPGYEVQINGVIVGAIAKLLPGFGRGWRYRTADGNATGEVRTRALGVAALSVLQVKVRAKPGHGLCVCQHERFAHHYDGACTADDCSCGGYSYQGSAGAVR